jgi:hypothetical protein
MVARGVRHRRCIGDRRNHAHRESGRLSTGNRSTTLWRVTPAAAILAADPCFIAPHDLSVLLFGALHDPGIGLAQPLFNGRRLLFVSAFAGMLRREAPTRQIVSNRPDRHLHSIRPLNQFLNRLPGPQGKGHLQLLMRFIDNHALHFALLDFIKRSAGATRVTAPTQSHRFHAPTPVQCPPLARRRFRNIQQFGNLAMLQPFSPQCDRSATQLKLRIRTQLACISCSHEERLS